MSEVSEREETWNPFKSFSRYRRNRLFVTATKKFSRQVKVACISPVPSTLLINIADHFGGDETAHTLVSKSDFSGDKQCCTGRKCVPKMTLQNALMTCIGGDNSTEQRELSGIAIQCDKDIDDKLREIIEGVASVLTQQDPFDDPVEVVDNSEPCKSSMAWMFVDLFLM